MSHTPTIAPKVTLDYHSFFIIYAVFRGKALNIFVKIHRQSWHSLIYFQGINVLLADC